MGQQWSNHNQFGIQSLINDLQGYQYTKSLGNSPILKTIQCAHIQPSIVKLFIKSSSQSLAVFKTQILNEGLTTKLIPNVLTYHTVLETDKAGYLIRDYIHGNLYDKISTRPFLTSIEKRFITYQLLKAVHSCHKLHVYHGDIKTENCLITSWNWLLLSDFSSFKPVYLPDDNPAIFSIFFDASSRRTCYIAPERFQSSGDALFQTCTKLTPEMDIFSLGCTIAEIFLEGTALFTLSQLLRYRKNEYSPLDKLSQIKPEIREMIIEMIDLNPSKRHHTQYYLDKYNQIFIKDFKSCHDFIAIISDGDFGSSDTSFHVFMNQTTTPLVANIDARIEKMFKEFIDIMKICEIDIEDDLKYGVDSFPMFCDINGFTGRCDKIMNRGDDDLVLLFTTLVTSGIRNCLFPSSKLKALEMLLVFGIVLKDEYTLDRVIPFVVLMLSNSFDPVRMKALMVLTQLVSLVTFITAIDVNIFPEYIIPVLKPFAIDRNPCVRASYAKSESSLLFLEMSETLKDDPLYDLDYQMTYDAKLRFLQDQIQDDVVILLTDTTSLVKQALLYEMPQLCIFFGKQKSNDFLISHIITYLNDLDWSLRSSFCEAVVGIGTFVGDQSLEQFILPLLLMALTDSEEYVVEKVLASLSSLAELGLLRKHKMKELAQIIVPLVCHPNEWIRLGSIGFLATISKTLQKIDVQCIILPLLKPFLKYDTVMVDEKSLLLNLKPALNRELFDFTVEYAKTNSRSGKIGLIADKESDLLSCLRKKGMTNEDQEKLMGLKYFISKTGVLQSAKEEDNMYISLQEFSIIPHTVFLTPPVFEIGNEDLVLDEQIKPKQLEVGIPKCNSVGNFDLTLDQTTNQSTQSKKYDQDLGSIIDGQERHIRQLLEQKRLELSAPIIPGTLILIELGMKTKKAKSNDNWTPVGNLIAHFAEHQSTINSIKMSNDHSFFVSCSDDQKVKIWDTQRLKTNVTNRAKVTFDAKSAVKDVCFIQGRDSIVSCSADGKIHINRYLILIRVEYIKNQKGMTKYSPVKSVKTIQLVDDYATKVEHFDRDYSSLIVYATKNGQLSAVDLRCMKEAWTFNIPPHHGIITSMCVDANNNWISTGTHRGVVSLFDVRFQLNTNAWQHISRKPITHMETFCKGKIAMSVENFVKETSIWDLKSGKCEQVWCSKNTESGNELEEFYEDGLKPIMPLTSSQMLLEKPRKDFTKRTEKTYFAVCDRMKFMISGADRRLRFNDLLQPEKSFVFAGDSSPVFQTFKNHDVVFNVEQRSESFGQNFGRVSRKDEALLDVSGGHEDIITSVVIAKSPFCMVISGARDGVINVYQ